MTIIHAFKRNKRYVHEFPDVKLVFEPNAAGDVVCEVLKATAVDRLLATPTGFKLYDPTPEAIEAMKQAAIKQAEQRAVQSLSASNSERYVLISGTQTLDLRPLNDAQLRAFAKANGILLPGAAKGDGIRELIVEGLAKKARRSAAAKERAEAAKRAEEAGQQPPPPAGDDEGGDEDQQGGEQTGAEGGSGGENDEQSKE